MDISSISDQVGEALEKGVQSSVQNTKKTASDVTGSVLPGIAPQTPSVENLTQNPGSQNSQSQHASIETLTKMQDDPALKAADATKIDAVRKKLAKERHDEVYYNPTFVNRKPDENRQRIEQEKVEEEKKELILEEQKKQKVPLALQRSQQKIERLPDAG